MKLSKQREGITMKKKIISALLCVAMTASLVVGCGSGTSEEATAPEAAETESVESAETSTEKTKIRMSYWNSEDTVQTLLDYLAEEVPEAEIEFQFIDNSNYDTIIDTQLSAEEGPDIICESPGSALKHARLGYLEPVNDLGALYSDAGTRLYSYDGNVYALPGISWFEGCYFNKALFEENNIALPTTFDEYIAVCKQFQELGLKVVEIQQVIGALVFFKLFCPIVGNPENPLYAGFYF